MQVVPTKAPTAALLPLLVCQAKLLKKLEARAGIEPAHKGFADLSLTTWVPRLVPDRSIPNGTSQNSTGVVWNGAGDET